MPNLSDYIFAPWKIIGLLFDTPGKIPGPPAAAAKVHEGLCYVQDVGGELLRVCHVGSYEMPAFIFVASLMILLLFIGASVALLFQCSRLSFALTQLSNHLGKLKTESKAVTGKDLAAIRNLMIKEKTISPLWHLYEETLLVAGQGAEVYSTQSAEALITKSALIEENVQSALFNAIPGILTGVGLLMTFVAILDGLSHVTVTSNMDVKGIGGLINGLSGKFVSSIVAVTCAVFFVFVERIAYSGPDRAYRRIITAITARFRRRSTEHLLAEIQTQLLEQASLIQQMQGRVPPPPRSRET